MALAQIGEFSFLLASTGVARKVITGHEAQLVVAVTVMSLMISPLWLASARRLEASGNGFSTLGQLLGAVYGPEARRVGLMWGGSCRLLVRLRQRWRGPRRFSAPADAAPETLDSRAGSDDSAAPSPPC